MEMMLNDKKPMPRGKGLEIAGRIMAVIPGLLIVVGVVIGLVLPFCLSLTDWNMVDKPAFVGWENYRTLFRQDSAFSISLENSVADLLIIGYCGFVACLLISLLIRTLPRVVKYMVIVLLLAPLVCPGITRMAAYVFSSDSYGFFNGWLMHMGLIREPILYLTTPGLLLHIARWVQILRSIGPGVLIISAGLDSVRQASLEESRQRGLQSHFGVFWCITLRRMRLPLMLAAMVMGMGAMGTVTVSRELVGTYSGDYSAYTLWAHVFEYGLTRYEAGYASASLCVTHAVEAAMMLVMLGLIFLLTLRPASWRCRRLPAPQESRGLKDGWDDWRVMWTLIGAVAAQTLIVPPLFLLLMEGNKAFMPMEEVFCFPPGILVQNPSLDNFRNLFFVFDSGWVSVWGETLGAMLFALIPMLLTAGMIGLAGYESSRRHFRLPTALLVVLLMVVLLCCPVAKYFNIFMPHGYTDKVEFAEALTWTLWAFVPVSVVMGLSFGEICRRMRPVRRLIMAGVGYGCLVLYLCVRGSLGWYMGLISAGSFTRVGMMSAGNMLLDTISLLLLIPIVMGAFQMLSGLGDLRPLYRGGEE